MNQNTIPVHVEGTPIWYNITKDAFAWEKKPSSETKYIPGEIVHTCLGRLRCEEARLTEDGMPAQIICSVVNEK